MDWVLFESYSYGNSSTFTASTSHFYNLLTSESDSTHDYLSKPWGIGEFGTNATVASVHDTYFTGIKADLDSNEYPNLKLLSVYDSTGPQGDFEVAYNNSGQPDPANRLRQLGQGPVGHGWRRRRLVITPGLDRPIG